MYFFLSAPKLKNQINTYKDPTIQHCDKSARFSAAPPNLETRKIPSEISPGVALRVQVLYALREVYDSFEYFLGGLYAFPGIEELHGHQDRPSRVYIFMPFNSLSLDLFMRLPIPGDDMLMHSSFSWNWILCRNVPPLFVDVLLLLLLLLFKKASLQWNLSPYSRSVLNKGSNCFEIPT